MRNSESATKDISFKDELGELSDFIFFGSRYTITVGEGSRIGQLTEREEDERSRHP